MPVYPGKTITGMLLAFVMTALALPAPAHAGDEHVFIEVNPSTIQAGHEINIRASCGHNHDHDNDANTPTVRSRAFNETTLQRKPDSHLLSGTVHVSAHVRAGNYRVELRCAGSTDASTELHVVDMARPTVGPPTGGGGSAGASSSPLGVPLLAGSLLALGLGVGLLLRRSAA